MRQQKVKQARKVLRIFAPELMAQQDERASRQYFRNRDTGTIACPARVFYQFFKRAPMHVIQAQASATSKQFLSDIAGVKTREAMEA